MEINRRQRPETAEKADFILPAFSKYKLENVPDIYFIPKHDLPIVRAHFIVNNGSRFDPLGMKGLSNLLSMCIDEGAGKLDSLQLSDAFDILGANFSVTANSDVTMLKLQTLSDKFDAAFNLFKDVILSPNLNEKDFLREKRNIATRLIQLEDDPDYLANSAFEFLVYEKNNPYAYQTIGTKEGIKDISVENVRDFYQNNFLRGNSAILIVGNIPEDILLKQIDEFSRTLKSSSNDHFAQVPPTILKQKLFIINKKDSVQTEIRTGHISSKRNEKDYYAKNLLNIILGGQFSSRINLNLREKNGYTYGARSGFTYNKEASYFGVSTSVGIDKTTDSLREIFFELKKINEGVTEEETGFAKSSVIKRYPSNFETFGHIAANYSNKIIYELPDNYFDLYAVKINNVTLNEINIQASKSINVDNATTVLVGDAEKLDKQINGDEFGEKIFIEFDELFS